MLRKISCLLPLCLLLALSSCGASPSAEQVLDQLEESIQLQDGALSFQLPAHSEDGWNHPDLRPLRIGRDGDEPALSGGGGLAAG